MTTNNNDFNFRPYGKRFEEARDAAGLSVERAAELIGRTVRALEALERGENGPSLKTLVRMGEAYNVPPGNLLPHTKVAEDVAKIEELLDGLDSEARRILLKSAIATIEKEALMLRRMENNGRENETCHQ